MSEQALAGEQEYDVFISHSSQDKRQVEALKVALESRDISCWVSYRDLELAREFPAEIVAGIKQSRAFIVVISSAAVESEYVRGEVKIARDHRRRVLPVRLDDAPLRHGLELLLSLPQQVNLFEGSLEAQYDRIARALKSDDGPSQLLPMAASSPLRSRSRAVFWGVGLLLAGLLIQQLLQVWFVERARSGVEEALKGDVTDFIDRAQQEQMRRAGVADPGNGPTVQFQDWAGQGVQLQISKSPRNTRAFYSTDGRQFVEYGRSTTFQPAKDGKFIVMLKDAAGKEVAQFDRSADFAAAMRASLEESARIRVAEPQDWGCDVYGCRFLEYSKNPVVCSAFVAGINFGTAPNDAKSNTACEPQTGQLCVSAADLPFQLRPGNPVRSRLTLLDGSQLQVDIPTVLAMNMRAHGVADVASLDRWLELQPLTERNPKGRAPFAAARYSPPYNGGAGAFKVLYGVDACDSQRARLLADSDGRGLIDAGEYRGEALNAYYVPGPIQHDNPVILDTTTKALALAVDHGDGRTTGPYWYSFNAGRIAQHTGAVGETPEIICPGAAGGYVEQTYRVCRAANPLAWSKVVAVRLGREQGALSQEIKIHFDAEEYLRSDCRVDLNRCPPFFFKIPPGWTDVFSAIAMADGKAQRVVRHVLPKE